MYMIISILAYKEGRKDENKKGFVIRHIPNSNPSSLNGSGEIPLR